MRSCLFVSATLAVSAGLGLACAHDKRDGQEFTQEQLDELERKWGMDVRLSFRLCIPRSRSL